MYDIEPFTGYGDDTNSSIKFGIMFDDDYIADWEGGDPILSKHPIANSNRNVTQYHGRTPYTMTCLVTLANKNDLMLLWSVSGTPATLRYKWGVTVDAGGEKVPIGDDDYLVLPGTILEQVKPVRNTGVVGEEKMAYLTFTRPAEESDYYGFALYGEDD
jgi:hypothetical protein